MEIGQFVRDMERVAPPGLAEEMDSGKIGLIIEGNPEIGRICCALDCTRAVVEEAVRRDADMLLVHHTPIWNPVTAIRDPLAPLLRRILSSGLNLYVMHTNFDHAPGGVNDALADLLYLEKVGPLSLGLVGECPLILQEIADRLGCPLRVWGEPQIPGTLAVVGGAGFDPELIAEARDYGAGTFLSSDLRHSVARSSTLPLIEATHYALEAPGMRALAESRGWEFIDDPPSLRIWTNATSGRD